MAGRPMVRQRSRRRWRHPRWRADVEAAFVSEAARRCSRQREGDVRAAGPVARRRWRRRWVGGVGVGEQAVFSSVGGGVAEAVFWRGIDVADGGRGRVSHRQFRREMMSDE